MDKANEESQEWTCVYFSPSPDKAIEESQEWTGFYFSPSPSYFPQSPPPPFQFSPSPPPSCPPSPNSFVVCQLASQSMEMSPQNQQHDDSLDPPPQYFDRYWALVQQQLLQLWTDTLNLITRGRIMSPKMSEHYNSQGFFRSPAPEYIGVWQGHGSEWVARIRLRWNWLIIGTFETAKEAAIAHDEAALRFRGVGARLNFPKRVSTTVPSMDTPPPPPPQLPSTAQKENRNEDSGLVNDEVEVAIGIGVEGKREGEITEDQLNSGWLGKRKRNEKSPGGESGNKKTDGVRAGISLDDILQTKAMSLKDATKNVNVSRSTLECTCRECGIHIWPPHKLISQSHANETPAVVDQERIPQSISKTLLPFSEVETVEIGGEGTVNGEMEESQLNPECLVKGERKVKTRGERGNKKTTGVRIAIALEDILQAKGMLLKDAAKHLKVSISTLKRVCRGYQIYRWPPREEHKFIGQSHPNEPLAVGDQERNPQLNFAMQLSNQESASIDTSSVTVKARYEGETFKFQLSKQPWEMAELEEQVKKRLKLEALIKYEDEDGELISIACDDDLRYHISRSRSQDTTAIVVLLQRKKIAEDIYKSTKQY